jgi:hypothetical protein
LEVGVTIYWTLPETFPGFVNVWAMVEPDPAVAPVIPPAIVPIVHVNVLGILAVRAILVALLEQTWAVLDVVTVGLGLTVMVYVIGVPGQPLADGVTVIVAVMGDEVPLVAVKDGTLPVPDAPRPMAVLEFVHAKVVPDTGPVGTVAATTAPAQ